MKSTEDVLLQVANVFANLEIENHRPTGPLIVGSK
jgi:hypothetical protein